MAFDGARYFARFSALAIASCILAASVAGWWPLLGVAVGLYYLLSFFNALSCGT